MTDDQAPVDHQGMEVIPPDECWQLLASVPVGRVAFLDEGAPMVLPVNHTVAGRAVVFRTIKGELLERALRASVVAFEADDFDRDDRSGWSVVVQGMADLPEDEAALEELDLEPWADAVDRDEWVVIRAEVITGRRILR